MVDGSPSFSVLTFSVAPYEALEREWNGAEEIGFGGVGVPDASPCSVSRTSTGTARKPDRASDRARVRASPGGVVHHRPEARQT